MKTMHRAMLFGGICSMALFTSSCVDNDYDLSKDIDLTMTAGGNLTLPGSSTEEYTLSQILNLGDNSSLRPVAEGEYGLAEGDYVLEEKANPTNSSVLIAQQQLSNLSGSSSSTALDPFYNAGQGGRIAVDAKNIVDNLDIRDDNVTTDLISLRRAGTDIAMKLNVGFASNDFNGTAQIHQGATAIFDSNWEIETLDQATAAICEVVDGHILRFKTNQSFSSASPLSLAVRILDIDLSNVAQGQGLYAPGHFNINSKVTFNATVSIASSDIPVGSSANLNLITSTEISSALLNSVTGKVDPKININPSSFYINDVPDFLSEPGNNLDISNPIISFSTENASPVAVNINAKIRALYDDGSQKTIGIGDKNGTSSIILDANDVTNVFICREQFDYNLSGSNYQYVIVPELSTLISTIPKKIELYDIEAKATDSEVTIALGTDYNVTSNYNATIPLAFGQDMVLTYSTIENDWGEDLEDYNFSTALVTANIVNSIPLTMTPSVIALDKNGNEMTNITATVNGAVAPGTLQAPVTTSIEITLKSTGSSLSGLDGVKIVFHADTPIVGQNLNAKQSLRFDAIKISIAGGITFDLN